MMKRIITVDWCDFHSLSIPIGDSRAIRIPAMYGIVRPDMRIITSQWGGYDFIRYNVHILQGTTVIFTE